MLKACRYCLQTDGQLWDIKNSEAQNFIHEIFIQNGYQEIPIDCYICYMCKYLLNKSYKFIKKTLRAQQVLQEILKNNNEITNASLQNIDRNKLDLDNDLVYHENSINFYLWDETNCNYENDKKRCSSEILHNVCVTKRENEFGSDTFLTPIDYYPDVVHCQSESDHEHDLGRVKQENMHEIEIKVDVQRYDEKPLFNSEDFEDVKVDLKPFTFNDDSNDSSESKPNLRQTMSRKCKVKKEVKKKRKKPTKQKRIKKEKKDYRQYPMKCDDCVHMVQSKMEHFHHYLTFHKDLQYPYRKEGNFVCQHCGIVKTTAFHLSQHELTHGERNMECTQCGKRFHNLVRLQRHTRRHSSVPRFHCDFCGKGFFAREDIQLHIRTHTGEKPFQCWLCPARFAHRGNVAVHVRNVHQRDTTGKKQLDTQRKSRAMSTMSAESIVSTLTEN